MFYFFILENLCHFPIDLPPIELKDPFQKRKTVLKTCGCSTCYTPWRRESALIELTR